MKLRQLDMELFGGCNYSCSMCPQGSDKGREPEFKKALSWSNFLKIVDEAEKHGVESISLHGGGEPTLNKYFIPAIKYINCLLYTSPSPRYVEEARMASSA